MSLHASKRIMLNNTIFSKNSLRKAKATTDHPRASVKIARHGTNKFAWVSALADTGAQSNLWGWKNFQEAGFCKKDLMPVSITIRAANKIPINILGAFKATFSGMSPKKEVIRCDGIVYVSDSVTGFFLSYETMVDLLIINKDFPTIGSQLPHQHSEVAVSSNENDPNRLDSHKDVTCDCPPRSRVPDRPNKLPFEATNTNVSKMRDWLLQRYAASTFNVCPHKLLQQMSGPPLEIHLENDAKPRACHTPAHVPIHWQKQVEADLIRDVRLGVLERVPFGEPVSWCHRMVVTRKQDGSPRRTVDLSPLNKYCKRETCATDTPFKLARRIPKGTFKTVTDAWNGYHGVPLRESDKHLTTFITPFGRFRYTRAPQGFVSSGDGYNRRFAAILSDFERKERCVDDTIFFDSELECHWWRTIDFLSKVGNAGIILNPKKFQFCQKSVDFAGFRISDERIEPLPKYLDSIRNFPTPKSATDIRSWFGLINQVANYAKLRKVMAPFRDFLSPKCKFMWTEKLNQSFNESKEIIIDAIKSGVQIFDLGKLTCLRPDWSKQGLGYFLMQKHCKCNSRLPDCCTTGWKVTLAGSRFLNGAEKNYAAIEGESLAIAWSLEQTKYFTRAAKILWLLRIINHW